jgi:hypothetical protein
MRADVCFDAATEGATGGLLSSPTRRSSKAKAALQEDGGRAASGSIKAGAPKSPGPIALSPHTGVLHVRYRGVDQPMQEERQSNLQ